MARVLKDPPKPFGLLREHPILAVSVSGLICSATGYYIEYRLLREFGLDLMHYGGVQDLLLGGLKRPLVFLAFPGLFLGVPYCLHLLSLIRLLRDEVGDYTAKIRARSDELSAEERGRDIHINSMMAQLASLKRTLVRLRAMGIAALVGWALLAPGLLLVLAESELHREIDAIRSGEKSQVVLHLERGEVWPKGDDACAVVITTTEDYMFLLEDSDGEETLTRVFSRTLIRAIEQRETESLDSENTDVEPAPNKR